MKYLSHRIIEFSNKYGNEILNSPTRINAILNDLYPEKQKERNLFRFALDFGIVPKIYAIHKRRDLNIVAPLLDSLRTQFQNIYPIQDNLTKDLFRYWDMIVRVVYNVNLVHKEITYNNGKYSGQAFNGEETGKGIFTWADGDRYEIL